MARYIDADKLKTIIENEFENAQSQDEHYAYKDCLARIDKQPAADVVEVKHGEWIYEVKYYKCSNCAGKRFNLLLGTDAEYCPYCGTKMDGGNQ